MMIEYIIKIKKVTKNIFQDRWVWKMAWRDGHHNFSRLFLFVASLIEGIAAVVAIASLNYSLQEDAGRRACFLSTIQIVTALTATLANSPMTSVIGVT